MFSVPTFFAGFAPHAALHFLGASVLSCPWAREMLNAIVLFMVRGWMVRRRDARLVLSCS